MSSRIIDRDAAAQVDRWSYPAVDGSAAPDRARSGGAGVLTARQLEELQSEAHREAYERGFAEGLAAGKAELESRARRLAALADGLARPFEDLDREVTGELTSLALALASHVLRKSIELDAAPLAEAVAEAVAALPSAARDVTVYLHPDDAALVREHLPSDWDARFRLEMDPALARGDLRVTASSSEVDGRIETRLEQLVAAALSELDSDESSAAGGLRRGTGSA